MSPLGWLVAFILGAACGVSLWVNGTIVGENTTLKQIVKMNHDEWVVCQAKVVRLEIKKGGRK